MKSTSHSIGIVVCNWSVVSNGPLSEDAVRAIHLPINRHRVSKARFPPGASFPVSTREGTVYVLQGTCRYGRNGMEVEIVAGEFARLSEGTYNVQVLGSEDLVIVRAWELPFEVPGEG